MNDYKKNDNELEFLNEVRPPDVQVLSNATLKPLMNPKP